MSQTLAYISSSVEYTQGILPFVRRLEAHGDIVHWISFRNYERKWLLEQGVPADRVLDTLQGLDDPMPEAEVDERLVRLEGGRSPTVNHIVSMDRLIKLKSGAFARRYLAHVEKTVTAFLMDRGVRLVSGGRDTALQVATSKICARLGIAFVVPTAVRLPDDRYGFCRGYTEARLVEFRRPEAADRERAAEYLAGFRRDKPVPSAVLFERRNNQFLRRVPTDIRLWWSMVRRGAHDPGNDFTRYSLRQLLGMYWRRRWNAMSVRLAPPFQSQGGRPFVLYAYQMQPESGIDTLAAHYSDQVTLVRQIARAVPASHDFYVKPHPDHVGGLPRARMVEIARIPGVTLIDPDASGRQLMHRASLIVTPAGSMAYEAALHGIPSVIFADEFFRHLPAVHYCQSIEGLPDLVRRLVTSPPPPDDRAVLDYLAHTFANTFEGRVTSYLGAFSEQELAIMEQAYGRLADVLRPAEAAQVR